MARDKSAKGSSKSKAPAPPVQNGARARPTADDVTQGSTTSSKTKKSFFGFFRRKIVLTEVGQTDHDGKRDSSSNNNVIGLSSSFSEPGTSSKPEQSTRKVKRHLSVSRSGKMKEVRKRTSLSELAQRFDNQAQVDDASAAQG